MKVPKTASTRLIIPQTASGTEPANADPGTMSFDPALGVLRVKLVGGWVDVGGGGGGSVTSITTGTPGVVTITNPTGPAVNIDVTAGSGVTAVAAGDMITVANPTGPTATAAMAGFTTKVQKVTPAEADLLLLEDVTSSNAKKYATIKSVVESWDLVAELAPTHIWRASNVTLSGGNIDTFTDLGSIPKNFVFTGGSRAVPGVDGNGKDYAQFSSATYTAGVIADWNFLHQAISSWTLLYVMSYPSVLANSTQATLLATNAFSSGGAGITLQASRQDITAISATEPTGGMQFATFPGQKTRVGTQRVGSVTALAAYAVVFKAVAFNANMGGFTSVTSGSPFWVSSMLASYRNSQMLLFNQGDGGPNAPVTQAGVAANTTLQLGSNNGNAFFGGRLYELVVVPRACDDFEIKQYTRDAMRRFSFVYQD